MNEDRRSPAARDRRARPRGGRREHDARKPWYMRRRLWLAAASLLFVGWRRMARLAGKRENNRMSGLAA
jgi:hypothetical protein